MPFTIRLWRTKSRPTGPRAYRNQGNMPPEHAAVKSAAPNERAKTSTHMENEDQSEN